MDGFFQQRSRSPSSRHATIFHECGSNECWWLPKLLLKLNLGHQRWFLVIYSCIDTQCREVSIDFTLLTKYSDICSSSSFAHFVNWYFWNVFIPSIPSSIFSSAWICFDVSLVFNFFLSLVFVLVFFLVPQQQQHHFGRQLQVLLGAFFLAGAS